jgi:hypothetical protein
MGFLYDIFLRQLLTVLAVILSRPDGGRFVVRDKYIDAPTEQVGSNRIVGGEWRLRGYIDDSPLVEMRMKTKEGERECRTEKRAGNETEVYRLKMILRWAQIIERRLCEKVMWAIGVLQ